ncbi:MAG: SAM-dependent methyltransferase [Desulfuromonadaceae bacterium]|nr:SAM-dependent methyltransferase [Desulfuromonadaceae bacterium]
MTEQIPTSLGEMIRAEIHRAGGLEFSRYMEHCLYHPQWGYYMQPRQRIGAQGDFFTSSSVHHLFGALIARQLFQMWQLLGEQPFTLVEQGAGEGHLALDILTALQQSAPACYARLCYQIIEISPDNRQRQAATLEPHADRVRWCCLEELEPFEGCFLSNELVDAFPVSLLEKKQGQLFQVYVVEKEGVLSEELRPATDEVKRHFQGLGVEPVEGNRAEVCLAVAPWMAQLAPRLRKGFMLTIDYGYPAAELYAPFRRDGTLMCYHRHQANDNPYQRIGEQDMTAHVDFTLLQQTGDRLGLRTLYFGEQYRFLIGLGFVEELMRLQAREPDEKRACALRMTLKNLIVPDGGMGETFKVLIQGKNVDAPALICARSIRDLPMPELI